MFEEWLKGGLRQKLLRQRVPAYLEPASVQAFFIGVRKRGGRKRLINPFSIFDREYVIAATNRGISVLRLKRPGVFNAQIAGVEYEAPVASADVKWHGDEMIVGGQSYRPVSFHASDAEQVGRLLTQSDN
jgi:hypothetical protein